ncbi:MAG: YitT family protein [Clostridia bacterium]|nr:YitT family protein [Clostridia bacterium]
MGTVKNERIRELLIDGAAILGACVVMAFGMVVFTIPNNIAPGGLTGLATALSYLIEDAFGVHIGVGVLNLFFQVPCILVALRMFGVKVMIKTIITALVYSGSIELVSMIPNLYTHTDNTLLAAVFGGALIGLGVAILFLRGIATGGTDTISLILQVKFPHVRAGKLMMFVDAFVVLIAVIVFRDIEVALYSAVCIFVLGKVTDAVMQGIDNARVFMIVTDKDQELLPLLSERLSLGVTEIDVKGGYTHKDKRMLMTVVRRHNISAALKLIKETDKQAFIVMYNATEVIGRGFKEIDDEAQH